MTTIPIIRKVLQHGDSKAVTIPKSWLVSAEQKEGKKIVAVSMEVNRAITISPVFEKRDGYKDDDKDAEVY